MTTAASATDNKVQVIVSENGQAGLPGINGTDGAGFNNVRKSMLDNPTLKILNKNKLSDTVSGILTLTRSTSATFINRYGFISSAASDTEREEVDGFLLEGQSTNLAIRSDDFADVAWSKNNATITTSGSVLDPGGISFAQEFKRTSGGFSNIEQIGISVSGSTGYTVSCWLRGDGLQTFRFGGFETGGSVIERTIDVTPSVEWQRFELFFFTDAATTGFNFQPIRDALGTTALIYISRAQLELTSKATSYIDTLAAPATRTPDFMRVPILNNLPDTSKPFSVSMSLNPIITNVGNPILFDFRGSGSERVYMNNLNDIVLKDSTSDITIASSAVSPGVTVNLVISFDGSNVSCYVNGNLALAAQAYSFTGILLSNNLSVGSFNGTTDSLYGRLLDFSVFDFAINSDEALFLAGT